MQRDCARRSQGPNCAAIQRPWEVNDRIHRPWEVNNRIRRSEGSLVQRVKNLGINAWSAAPLGRALLSRWVCALSLHAARRLRVVLSL